MEKTLPLGAMKVRQIQVINAGGGQYVGMLPHRRDKQHWFWLPRQQIMIHKLFEKYFSYVFVETFFVEVGQATVQLHISTM